MHSLANCCNIVIKKADKGSYVVICKGVNFDEDLNRNLTKKSNERLFIIKNTDN